MTECVHTDEHTHNHTHNANTGYLTLMKSYFSILTLWKSCQGLTLTWLLVVTVLMPQLLFSGISSSSCLPADVQQSSDTEAGVYLKEGTILFLQQTPKKLHVLAYCAQDTICCPTIWTLNNKSSYGDETCPISQVSFLQKIIGHCVTFKCVHFSLYNPLYGEYSMLSFCLRFYHLLGKMSRLSCL